LAATGVIRLSGMFPPPADLPPLQREQAAQALQSELTNLSSNSTRRVIEGSDHGSVITNERHAQQTSEEILKVVQAVRTGQPLGEQ
jgi:hypothetical protein